MRSTLRGLYRHIWLILLVIPLRVSAAPEQITLFTYHTHPPFVTAPSQGLSYELATLMTRLSDGKYQFVVKPMSRRRVDKMLEEQRRGIIPWVNPAWFRDDHETSYLWSAKVLMVDGNALVSHQSRKIDYNLSASIAGLKFGGVHGHYYEGLDYQNDNITRIDAANHLDNIRKLTKHLKISMKGKTLASNTISVPNLPFPAGILKPLTSQGATGLGFCSIQARAFSINS